MREIKFRARHIKNKQWYYGQETSCEKDPFLPFSILWLWVEMGVLDKKTVGEYTGLKDKNGVEIYEGDYLGGMWDHTYIAYCDKCKSFEVIIIGRDKPDECLCCSGDVMWQELVEEDGKIEVIGNIYENKELLK